MNEEEFQVLVNAGENDVSAKDAYHTKSYPEGTAFSSVPPTKNGWYFVKTKAGEFHTRVEFQENGEVHCYMHLSGGPLGDKPFTLGQIPDALWAWDENQPQDPSVN